MSRTKTTGWNVRNASHGYAVNSEVQKIRRSQPGCTGRRPPIERGSYCRGSSAQFCRDRHLKLFALIGFYHEEIQRMNPTRLSGHTARRRARNREPSHHETTPKPKKIPATMRITNSRRNAMDCAANETVRKAVCRSGKRCPRDTAGRSTVIRNVFGHAEVALCEVCITCLPTAPAAVRAKTSRQPLLQRHTCCKRPSRASLGESLEKEKTPVRPKATPPLCAYKRSPRRSPALRLPWVAD